MEKEILAKTISRLTQHDSDVSRIQKDKILLRYQHQLGLVIIKIEKLESVSKYPYLSPVGDSLISLMDKRLSQLDQKLYEISSKISENTITQTKKVEKSAEISIENLPPFKKIEPKLEIQNEKTDIQKDKIQVQNEENQKERTPSWLPPLEVPMYEKHRMVELSTLTEITNKIPKFPAEFIRPTRLEPQMHQEVIQPKVIVEDNILPPQPNEQYIKEDFPLELTKPEALHPEEEKKIKIPTPMKIPEEEKIEDDDKDLDKIKSEIMKALSKLEQVEVE
jgi:hypothetical protein